MNLAQKYKQELLNSIPVVTGMNVELVKVDKTTIEIKAPLNTNINYEGTAFGGSINTVGILSCYLLAHHLINLSKLEFNSLVIQDSSIKYLKPIDGDFIAKSQVRLSSDRTFFKLLKEKGMGRISLESHIYPVGAKTPYAIFQGRFVATTDKV